MTTGLRLFRATTRSRLFPVSTTAPRFIKTDMLWYLHSATWGGREAARGDSALRGDLRHSGDIASMDSLRDLLCLCHGGDYGGGGADVESDSDSNTNSLDLYCSSAGPDPCLARTAADFRFQALACTISAWLAGVPPV